MKRQARILVVEDDPRLAELLQQELRQAGYDARAVATGGEALFLADEEAFELILLDLNLPDMDGLEVARWLHGRNQAAIIMLTARGDVDSRVEGLYSGAADYLTKPFAVQELLARIHARLRERAPSDALLRHGSLVLDPGSCSLVTDQGSQILPEREFELLRLLLANRGRLFSKEELERRLYGPDTPASNTIEVFVYNLRRKLGRLGLPQVITTVRNKGYMIR